MNAKNSLVVVIITLAFAGLAAGGQRFRPVSFPSASTQAVSPDGRYAVVNVDRDTEPYHTLFLEDRSTKSRTKILEYGRHVDVLWSPRSTLFAITNYAGSNIAQCVVFFSRGEQAPVNVTDEILRDTTNKKDLKILRNNDHVYYAAMRWTSPRALRVKVWGHGDESPSGFTRFYTVRIKEKR